MLHEAHESTTSFNLAFLEVDLNSKLPSPFKSRSKKLQANKSAIFNLDESSDEETNDFVPARDAAGHGDTLTASASLHFASPMASASSRPSDAPETAFAQTASSASAVQVSESAEISTTPKPSAPDGTNTSSLLQKIQDCHNAASPATAGILHPGPGVPEMGKSPAPVTMNIEWQDGDNAGFMLEDDGDTGQIYCICRQPELGRPMVQCASEECPIRTYHASCVGRDSDDLSEDRNWFCKICHAFAANDSISVSGCVYLSRRGLDDTCICLLSGIVGRHRDRFIDSDCKRRPRRLRLRSKHDRRNEDSPKSMSAPQAGRREEACRHRCYAQSAASHQPQ